MTSELLTPRTSKIPSKICTGIYPEETGITLIPNRLTFSRDHVLECNLLDTHTFVDSQGQTHVTLVLDFLRRSCPTFRINTHSQGFLQNVADMAAYLIVKKRYPQTPIVRAFSRFLDTQKGTHG